MSIWPDRSTAILIVHGIGEQHPFQTLDAFTSTCWNVLEKLNGRVLFPGKHRVVSRAGWVQNYISLARKKTDRVSVDFYEYYWAHKVQRQVKLVDIVRWLVETSEGARKFYAENEALVVKYEGTSVDAFKKGRFRKHWYLKHLGWFMRLLSIFPSVVPIRVSKILSPFLKSIEKKAIDFVGDIVVYTTTDIRSKFFSVRKEVLDGAVEELRLLLEDKRYRRIIVVGHSLGSVIGFDALNRVNHAMNVGIISRKLASKITGFITFGSPLDKIAFFFREHTPDDEYLRRQILAHYHGFKARPLSEQPNPKELANPIKPLLEHVHWTNFWDAQDKVSGKLDFYRVDENKELGMGESAVGAHNAYWEFEEMYERIANEYLAK